ncbi:MAG: hypothetical protein M5U34_28465 [Chloroflexi bacterium]|nr:hypothetical protein [Chloroflexota bacterium]
MEIKPLISESELLTLLTARLETAVTQIEPIATEQIAKGYFFILGILN